MERTPIALRLASVLSAFAQQKATLKKTISSALQTMHYMRPKIPDATGLPQATPKRKRNGSPSERGLIKIFASTLVTLGKILQYTDQRTPCMVKFKTINLLSINTALNMAPLSTTLRNLSSILWFLSFQVTLEENDPYFLNALLFRVMTRTAHWKVW